MAIKWGVTAGAHDASLAVFKDNELLFAGHAERYSRIKNDALLNKKLINEAMQYGEPDDIYWYENTLLKRTRQLYAKQWATAFKKPTPRQQLKAVGVDTDDGLGGIEERLLFPDSLPLIKSAKHHHSHAAAGYYTSPFTEAAVLVVDSIGEWECLTIWEGKGRKIKKRYSQSYPHSIGLWYSAMTQRIGLKPNEDEYILMGMAAIGDPDRFADKIFDDFFYPLVKGNPGVKLKHNLHRGCLWWAHELNTVQDYADIAAGTQRVYERIFAHLLEETRRLINSPNLVIMGGCALNCVANSIAYNFHRGNVWIMPNPGDAGSSVGCVLANDIQDFIEFKSPYLGTNIGGTYPVKETIRELLTNKMVGVANGRAEFGPRALGNRSLFADPRGANVQDLVNTVKQRQAFRPFAPVIMAEYAGDYFDGPTGPYMQYVSKCKQPNMFPAIAHYDNTSRVQTVTREQHPGLYKLLEEWHLRTGCPMLLNTSLNIKGEPIVNSVEDAHRWQERYGVKVLTKENTK